LSTSSSEFERGAVSALLLGNADRQAIAEVAVTLHGSKHGCIYFAVCNNRLKIEAVEAALAQALSPHGMGTERVVLAERDTSTEPPTYRVLIPDLFDYFDQARRVAPGFSPAGADLKVGATRNESRLYLIHGLPELIRAQTGGDSAKVAPISQLLNFRRELFHDRSLYTLFWLDPETVPYLMQKAPDFWSFRSGMAQFTETSDAMQQRDSSGWQQSAPSGRWSGDLEEKLRQLAVYRKKTPPDENAIANLLMDIGGLYVNRHEPQDAFDALHEAEDIFARSGLRQRVSLVKTWLSRAFKQTGQLDKAEESIREAMKIDQELKNEASLAIGYNNLSLIHRARGQPDEAENWVRKAIEVDERLEDEPHLAVDYNNLSLVYQDRGQLDEAEKWLNKTIEIAERLGDEPLLTVSYNNLSQIYKGRGHLEEAEKWLRMAVEIAERLGDEPDLAIYNNNLSQIYQARGQLEEAEKWLRKAIGIAERLGDEPNLAIAYNNLGQIYKTRGRLEEAEKWLRKAIEIDERLGDEPNLAADYNNLSQIHQTRGELEEAEKWLRKATVVNERLGDEPHLAICYNNLSLISGMRGQLDETEKWLRMAIEIAERLGDEPNLALYYNNLGQIYQVRGDFSEAEKWVRKALALMEPKGPSATLETLKSNLEQLEKGKKQQAPLP